VRQKYVWVVQSPKGKIRLFLKEESMRAAIPESLPPKCLDAAKKKWSFGKREGGKFFAQRLPIEDSDNLPVDINKNRY
jgi:hypothetical protein